MVSNIKLSNARKMLILGGMISVMLVADSGYTVGMADTATVTVKDISIPELSIADANQTVAGDNAMFVVTSDIPFVK